MTKLCSVCGTENRDDAQFCRSCGTAFAPVAEPGNEDSLLAVGITCDECGFQNKPGVRYCANCGVSLLGTVIVPRARPGATTPDPYGATSPPPISYPSFAPVAPYPPAPSAGQMYAPVAAPGYPPAYDDQPVPDLPDPAAELAVARMRDDDGEPPRSQPATFVEAKKPSRVPLIAGGLVAVLVVAGAAAWWFMSSSSGAHAPAAAASAPEIVAPAPAVVPVEQPAAIAAAPTAAASAPDASVVPPDAAASAFQPSMPPVVAMPPVTEPVVPGTATAPHAADDEARRIAAQKRHDKALRDKADRDARQAIEQREQAQAAARAEQDAARRRAEDAVRARQAATAQPQPAPAAPKPRGVREICAGRGTIGESMCQSRECGAAEHAGEAICKQVKEAEDRHRN